MDFRPTLTSMGLSDRLEGRSRPGHFSRGDDSRHEAAANCAGRILHTSVARNAQQSRLITQMACDLNLDTEIVVCPPVREPDGLALFPRENVYLNPDETQGGYRFVSSAGSGEKMSSLLECAMPLQLQSSLRRKLDGERLATVDYAEIVDAESFEPVVRVSKTFLHSARRVHWQERD